jgi:hypothetical protein
MSPKKLYSLLVTVCFSSYLWILFSYQHKFSSEACPFRRFTHLPCPSCGSTRAVLSILHGDLLEALFLNPLGFVIVLLLLLCPLWLLFDLFTGKTTLFKVYQSTEIMLKRPVIMLPLILLISVNWIWNIIKGI